MTLKAPLNKFINLFHCILLENNKTKGSFVEKTDTTCIRFYFYLIVYVHEKTSIVYYFDIEVQVYYIS